MSKEGSSARHSLPGLLMDLTTQAAKVFPFNPRQRASRSVSKPEHQNNFESRRHDSPYLAAPPMLRSSSRATKTAGEAAKFWKSDVEKRKLPMTRETTGGSPKPQTQQDPRHFLDVRVGLVSPPD